MAKPTKEELENARDALDSAISAFGSVALSLGVTHPVALSSMALIVATQRLLKKLLKELKPLA